MQETEQENAEIQNREGLVQENIATDSRVKLHIAAEIWDLE